MPTLPTPHQLLEVDVAVIGETEHPPNSNHIFVWRDLIKWKLAPKSIVGQPYCRGGIVWTCKKAGAPILPVQAPFYCPSAVQYARAHKLWDDSGHYDPVDEVYFSWTGLGGLAEHVGRVVKDNGSTITTFEFNTSSGNAGSQANGDGVWRRQRPHGSTVLGVLKYSEILDHVAKGGSVPKNPIKRNPFAGALREARLPIRLGDHGDAVRAVQWAVGVPVDGVFGPNTQHGVMVFQRYHQDRRGRGLHLDGQVGKLTEAAILRITHHKHS